MQGYPWPWITVMHDINKGVTPYHIHISTFHKSLMIPVYVRYSNSLTKSKFAEE